MPPYPESLVTYAVIDTLSSIHDHGKIKWGQVRKKMESGLGQAHHPEADIAIGILGRGGLAGGGAQVTGTSDPGAALEEA
jgi:hypothetical protein